MWIKSLNISGFGRARGAYKFERGRVNLVVRPNAAGKTTLADAILYALYDFPGRGGPKGELRPRDRYKPWAAGDPFRVEMVVETREGRGLRIEADFSRQGALRVWDEVSGKAVELEGQAPGARFLGMPAAAFSDCLYLRQDVREMASAGGLVQLIEQSAASAEGRNEAPVRRALEMLVAPRLFLEGFAAGRATPDHQLKLIAEQAADASARLRALEEERDRRAVEIARAAELDAKIDGIRVRQSALELEVAAAELAEAQSLLERQREFEMAADTREARIRDLEAFAVFDPELAPRAQQLAADLRAAQAQLEQGREAMRKGVEEPLNLARQEMALFPEALAAATRADFDSLRTLQQAFRDQKTDAAQAAVRCNELGADLASQGVPVADFEQVMARVSAVPPADVRALMDHDSQVSSVRALLAAQETRHAEASARVAEARAGRERLRARSGLVFILALALAGLTLMCGLMGVAWLAVIFFLAGAAAGSAGFYALHRAQVHGETRLEPAMAGEVSASSEVKRLRERLDTLEADFRALMERRKLGEKDLDEIRQMGRWSQMLAPYQAALEVRARSEQSLASTCEQVAEIARMVQPSAATADVDEIFLNRCVKEFERHFETRERRAKLEARLEEVLRDLVAREEAIAAITADLGSLVGETVPGAGTLEERTAAFLHGCEQARVLRTLREGPARGGVLSAEEGERLRQRAAQLRERLGSAGFSGSPRARAEIQEDLDRLAAEREETRLGRVALFGECDRAVEAWRREGPALREELDRLDALRRGVERYRDACGIAHAEMSAIAERVFTTWATELNQRLNALAPEFVHGFRDLAVDDELGLSLYSEEARRRLSGRELQHLSRGQRDQLLLVVRVAIAEFLANAAGPLPLVLDEPFAHWDDASFAEGMRFLARLAGQHQVIVLSCQASRFDRLLGAESAVAASVCRCDPESGADADT